MSRKGNYMDNVVAESFFKTIKLERVYQTLVQQVKKLNQKYFNLKDGTTEEEFTALKNKNQSGKCLVSKKNNYIASET